MSDEHAAQAGPGQEVAPVAHAENPLAPGLPPHRPRRADVDPRAAKRAERQVALLFTLSALCTIGFIVGYVEIPNSEVLNLPLMGAVSASNFTLGVTLGLAIFLIGAGAIHWAKKLMPDVEGVDERHELRSSDETREAVYAQVAEGIADSGFGQRKLIRRTLLGAMALLPLSALVLLRDLGPLPGTELRTTLWAKGVRIVQDPSLQPIRPEDVVFGGLVSGLPATLMAVEDSAGTLNARAKSPVILIRLRPEEIVAEQGKNWDYEGILCYSKICTHVGCPTALYEHQTHHLLCPCHQSTFDLADAGKVVFGPAARAMPQLAITVDADGYLVAQHDFTQPIGPSFWERG